MKQSFTLKNTRNRCLWAAAFSLTVHLAQAQLPAFPGAEGAGKFTTGGRGTAGTPTTVYEVTSLADDGSIGTLRYAVNQTVAYRTIVFRVSGTVHLTSKLNIKANTTIAGQTAPGDGICLADYPVVISGDNVILRYIRCRMGDKNTLKTSPAGCGVPVAPFTAACMPLDGSGGDDALGNLGGKNIIIDHCSVSWSSDEALTVYRGDSVTMQWNLVSEPLNYNYHFETGDTDFEQHGYGGIWGSKHGSFHHNLLAHCRNRMPRFAGISTYTPAVQGAEMADFRNNVLYNWGINNVYGGEGGYYNMVNNYLKPGPSSTSRKTQIVAIDSSDGVPYAKYYLSGNYITSSTTNTANNWLGVAMKSGLLSDTVKSKVTVPFDLAPIAVQTALDAYDAVLKYAGCALPNRDTLDQRIVNDVKNGTGRIIDVQGGYPHATPYASTVNAWPTLGSTTAPTDTDHDGMPDSWETAAGLNPADAADRANVAANGYTNLENYLNSLAANAIILTGTPALFSQVLGTPSAVQTYTLTGRNLMSDVTITAPAGYEISPNGTTWYNSTAPLTLAQTNGSINATTVSVRLNATAAGTYNGGIAHTNNLGTTVLLAVQGSAGTTTAVSNVAAAEGFSFYPNPVHEKLVVKHPRLAKETVFAVYGMDGKKLFSVKGTNGSVQTVVSTSKLAKGSYLLQAQSNGRLVALNFIKL